MTKTFKLTGAYGFVEDNSPVVLTKGEELEIKLITDSKKLYASISNEDKRETVKIADKSFIVPEHFLIPGELSIRVSQIINGEQYHTWDCDRLIIKDVAHGYEIIPEIAELKAQINELRQAVLEIYKIVKETELF